MGADQELEAKLNESSQLGGTQDEQSRGAPCNDTRIRLNDDVPSNSPRQFCPAHPLGTAERANRALDELRRAPRAPGDSASNSVGLPWRSVGRTLTLQRRLNIEVVVKLLKKEQDNDDSGRLTVWRTSTRRKMMRRRPPRQTPVTERHRWLEVVLTSLMTLCPRPQRAAVLIFLTADNAAASELLKFATNSLNKVHAHKLHKMAPDAKLSADGGLYVTLGGGGPIPRGVRGVHGRVRAEKSEESSRGATARSMLQISSGESAETTPQARQRQCRRCGVKNLTVAAGSGHLSKRRGCSEAPLCSVPE